jgi:pimeloyl-ACP methyl ester carboxylesterase
MISVVDSGRRAVAYDRRGHGRSDDPGRGYDYETLARDLASMLERLDLRDVTLVAHSMGSGEAVRYLTAGPFRPRAAGRPCRAESATLRGVCRCRFR